MKSDADECMHESSPSSPTPEDAETRGISDDIQLLGIVLSLESEVLYFANLLCFAG